MKYTVVTEYTSERALPQKCKTYTTFGANKILASKVWLAHFTIRSSRLPMNQRSKRLGMIKMTGNICSHANSRSRRVAAKYMAATTSLI